MSNAETCTAGTPLGRSQTFYHERTQHDVSRSVVVAARVCGTPPPRRVLVHALRAVIAQNPMLVTAVRLGVPPHSGPLSSVEARALIKHIETPELDSAPSHNVQNALEPILTQLIDRRIMTCTTAPLWRVCVLGNSGFLAIVANHFLLDGVALASLLKLLVVQLNVFNNDNVNDDDNDEVVYRYTPPFPAVMSIEHYVSDRPSLGLVISTIARIFLPHWIVSLFSLSRRFGPFKLPGPAWPRPTQFPLLIGNGPPEMVTRVALATLSASQTANLHKACVRSGIRITAAIVVAAVSALSTILSDDQGNQNPNLFKVCVPVDLRRYFPPNMEYRPSLGCFASAVTLTIPSEASQKDPKTLAQTVHRTLHDEVKRGMPLQFIGLLRLVDMSQFVTAKKGKFSGDSLQISNLGNIQFNGINTSNSDTSETTTTTQSSHTITNKDKYVVENVYFGQSCGSIGAYFNIDVIGFESGLRICTSCDAAMPLSHKLHDFRDLLMQCLNSLTNQTDSKTFVS